MAVYYVSQSENDNYGNQSRRFSYRHRSEDGKPVAQDLFNELRDRGEFVRLVRGEDDEWTELERANG